MFYIISAILKHALFKVYACPRNPWIVGFECAGLYPFDANRVQWADLIKGVKDESKRMLIQEFVANYRDFTINEDFEIFCAQRLAAVEQLPVEVNSNIEVTELGKSLIKKKKLPLELVELFKPPTATAIRVRRKQSTLKAGDLKDLYEKRLQNITNAAPPSKKVTRSSRALAQGDANMVTSWPYHLHKKLLF